MRILTAFILLLFLPSCVMAPSLPDVREGEPSVFVQYIKTTKERDTGNEKIQVRFHHNVSGYDGVVQELLLPSGETLVEYFRNHGDDFHDMKASDSWHECLIYPANVEGVDATGSGYAQLPQNLDGSVKTTTGEKFNGWYWKDYKTQGRVTKAARHLATRWKVTWIDGKASIEIQEGMEIK